MKKLTKQTKARKVKPMVTKPAKGAKKGTKYPKCPECKKDMYPRSMEYEAPKRYIVYKCDKCNVTLNKNFGNIQERLVNNEIHMEI